MFERFEDYYLEDGERSLLPRHTFWGKVCLAWESFWRRLRNTCNIFFALKVVRHLKEDK